MMKLLIFLLFLTLAISGIPSALFADSWTDDTPPGERTADGYKLAQGAYMDIPEDRGVRHVVSNVYTAESKTSYLTRKIENVEKRVASLEDKQQAQLEQIQTQLDEIKTILSAKASNLADDSQSPKKARP